jgi:hypothetical protein
VCRRISEEDERGVGEMVDDEPVVATDNLRNPVLEDAHCLALVFEIRTVGSTCDADQLA